MEGTLRKFIAANGEICTLLTISKGSCPPWFFVYRLTSFSPLYSLLKQFNVNINSYAQKINLTRVPNSKLAWIMLRSDLFQIRDKQKIFKIYHSFGLLGRCNITKYLTTKYEKHKFIKPKCQTKIYRPIFKAVTIRFKYDRTLHNQSHFLLMMNPSLGLIRPKSSNLNSITYTIQFHYLLKPRLCWV